MGTILHAAHAQDFERKKRPVVGAKESEDEDDSDDGDDEVEDSDDSDGAREEADTKKAKAVGDGEVEINDATAVLRDAERTERRDHASPSLSPRGR